MEERDAFLQIIIITEIISIIVIQSPTSGRIHLKIVPTIEHIQCSDFDRDWCNSAMFLFRNLIDFRFLTNIFTTSNTDNYFIKKFFSTIRK